MLFLYLLFISLLENIVGIYVIDCCTELKIKGVLKKIILIAGSVTISLAEAINRDMTFFLSVGIWAVKVVFLFFLLIGLTKGKWRIIGSIELIYFTGVLELDLLIGFLGAVPWKEAYNFQEFLWKSSSLRNISLIVPYVILGVMGEKIKIYRKKYGLNLEKGEQIFGIISVYLAITGYYMFVAFTVGNRGSLWINIIFIIISALFLFFICWGLLKYLLKQKELEQTIVKEALARKNYQEVSRLQEDFKDLRHNLNNQLLVVQYFLEKKEFSSAKKSLEEISRPIKSIEQLVHSGNEVLDMILNVKISQMRQHKIQCTLECERIKGLPFDDIEICVVFGNLLDNALEACEKMEDEKRWMKLKMFEKGGIFGVQITNSMSGEREEKEGVYKSTKKDGEEHGRGLVKVKKIIEEKGGTIKIDVKDRCFSVMIFV